MQYVTTCQSPLGDILLAADEYGLTGLWFEGEKFYALSLDPEHEKKRYQSFRKSDAGWTSTSPDANLTSCRPYI